MIRSTIKKTFIFSSIVQAIIICMICIDAIASKREYRLEYGIYATILSLQLFPIIFCILALFYFIRYKLKK